MDVSFSGEESAIPGPVGTQVYLAVREAIRNAVRHSGCSRIGLTLEVVDGELHGLVEDDGEGFDAGAVAEATPSWGGGAEVEEGEGRNAGRKPAGRLRARDGYQGGAAGAPKRAEPLERIPPR